MGTVVTLQYLINDPNTPISGAVFCNPIFSPKDNFNWLKENHSTYYKYLGNIYSDVLTRYVSNIKGKLKVDKFEKINGIINEFKNNPLELSE